MNKYHIRKFALHFILLSIFWVVMSGIFDLFHLSLGLFSVITVLWFNAKILKYNYFKEPADSGKDFKHHRLPIYLLYLLGQIVLSAIRVAYFVLHPKMPIKACIAKFKVNLPNTTARVLLANSITLTPGTITVDIKPDNTFIVHSLNNARDPVWMDHSLAYAVAKLYGCDVQNLVKDEVIIRSEDEL